MIAGRLISALVVVALGLLVVDAAFADVGSGSAVTVATGSGSGSGSGAPALPSELEAVKLVGEAYHQKDWFMLAGAALALVIYSVRWVLARKWPRWEESHYGVLISALIAGVGALAVSWSTGTDVVSSHTVIGALKLFAFATMAYVVPKKAIAGIKNTGTASSSDVPA